MKVGVPHAEGTRTRLLDASQPGAIETAAGLLQQGKLVVFPTDTLYGVGAGAFNEDALAVLYQVKQRSPDKGIPILLADWEDVDKVSAAIPPIATSLMNRFWPGPLTLIVPKHPNLPANISPNDGIAVRMPNSSTARTLIRAAGGVVAASSANRSGDPPARSGAEAMAALSGLVAAVLDGGPVAAGTASTIVDCRGPIPLILREGPISGIELALPSSYRQ